MSKSFWIYSSLFFGLVFVCLIWWQISFPLINIILIPFLIMASIVLAQLFEHTGETIFSAIFMCFFFFATIYGFCVASEADFLKILPIKILLCALVAFPYVWIPWKCLKETLEERMFKKVNVVKKDFNLSGAFSEELAKEIVKIKSSSNASK